jgi:hypothetical protein
MPTVKEKTARLALATKKVYDFLDEGGDIKSPEAVPIALAMVERYADVAKDLGDEIVKSITAPFDIRSSSIRPRKRAAL